MPVSKTEVSLIQADVVHAFGDFLASFVTHDEAFAQQLIRDQENISLALWEAVKSSLDQDSLYSSAQLQKIAQEIQISHEALATDLLRRIRLRPTSVEDKDHLSATIHGFAIEWMGIFARD